jgi:glutamine amidotransferase
MQLLSTIGSEGSENGTAGLDLIPGKVEHLSRLGCSLRIPHVGWNSLDIAGESAILSGIPGQTDFYFVHSFAFVPVDPAHTLATVDYGCPVVAAIQSGLVFGTQFHPEKSSKAGFRLLRNFLELAPC